MRRIAAAILFVSFFASYSIAQNTNASVTGFIEDPSKAVIPDVRVVAINIDTNAQVETHTGKDGSYVLPSLPAGPYRMQIEKPGFKTILKEDIVLHVQAALEVNFQMAVGSASESVTVTGNTGEMQVDGTVSTVIDKTLIENMPLNGKDLTTLFELSPGTLLNAGGSPATGGGFSVDGQRPTANYLTVDGVSGNAFVPIAIGNFQSSTGAGIATSASGGTNGILPVDAIEEYRMDTATYTAENGRTPGGQIQVRTRSGTNQFHGTLFENFRNQILDAEDWFTKYDNLTQAPLRMNELGGTLGGPMVIPRLFDGRNKLFFFVANDNLVLDQPNTNSRSEVPDASVVADAYLVFKTWLSVFPAGNGGQIPNNPSFDYFNASYPDLIRDHTTSVRLDWQLPQSIHAFFRVNLAPSSSVVPSQPGDAADGDGGYVSIDTYTAGLTIPLGIRMVDELTANHTSDNIRGLNFTPSIGGNSPNALADNLPSGVLSSLDNFTFVPTTSNYSADSESTIGPTSRNELHQWNVVDTFALHEGKSTLKFGVDFLSKQSTSQGPRNTYFVQVYGAAAPPYTNTDLDTGVISYLQTEDTVAHPVISLSNTSLFVNDDWNTTSSLTLNAGVRWEFNPAPTVDPLGAVAVVGDNLNPATFQDALSTKPLYQSVYSNFAPRFGFAWKPGSNSDTVVRGGVGIYFDTGQAATVAGTVAGEGYPYLYTNSLSEVPYTSINWSSLGTPILGATTPLFLVDPHLLSPRTYEWSLTVDQALGKSAKLTTSYVGNDGEKLIGQNLYYNYPNSSGQYPVNLNYVSEYGGLYIATNQSHSNYQALQIQLTSRMGQRFNALVSYTLEHAEDNGSSDFSSVGALALNPLANSANDIPQMFAAAIHYAPEGVKGNRILRAVTVGWGFDTISRLQSASPITVTYSGNYVNPNSFTTNADVVPGVPTVLHEHISNGMVVPGNKLLNWAAFTAPPVDASGKQLRNGDSATNGFRLFGLKQWDMSASRTWSLWRELGLNFRVDAFNLLNTVNFAGAGSGSWSPFNMTTFGMSNSTYASFNGTSPGQNSSGQQLAVFQNGGPRELQLSMKLKF